MSTGQGLGGIQRRPFDAAADEQRRQETEAQIEAESHAFFMSGKIYDDAVLDPRDTRDALGVALSATHSAPVTGRVGSARSGCDGRYVSSPSRNRIRTLLVANRGEIACRILRTAEAMGISTVAVFSDADADSPHVAQADVAVRLPGVAAVDTYLRGDLIIEAARRTDVDAIHPGYGFLSENASFAQAADAS